jgi:predicted restriction endonuclease
VIGEETLDTDYKFDDLNNILWLKVADDYNSLPKKVIAAYIAVSQTFSFKYIFKTDDDQILTKPKFFDIITNLIKNMTPTPHYGGYIVDIKQPYLSQYNRIHPELPKELPLYKTKYCSGRFYFLSRSAISNLINKREKIEKEYLEDYAIGYNLHDIFKTNMLNIASNHYFTDIENSDFTKWIEEGKI